jgi:hypothetical protein
MKGLGTPATEETEGTQAATGQPVTAWTEGTPSNSRNAGYKYQQQQGCQQQFMDASNSRADCQSFENRKYTKTRTLQGNQQQHTTLQMRRKHNRNASNCRDASNNREATEKISATFWVLAQISRKNRLKSQQKTCLVSRL